MKTFFVSYSELQKRLQNELCNKYDENLMGNLIELGIVPSVSDEGVAYFLEEDILLCKRIIENNYNILDDIISFWGYRCDLINDIVKLGKGTYIRIEKDEKKQILPSYIRYVCILALEKYEPAEDNVSFELPGAGLISNNQYVITYCEHVKERKDIINRLKVNDFANTSTYMGIKKNIMDFVVEAIIPHCNCQTEFLDIMCGSGTVSSVLEEFGRTYASDAQKFCSLLAKVQGKGLTVNSALKWLDFLYPYYIQNVDLLSKLFDNDVRLEEEIFHVDTANIDGILNLYEEFVSKTELYSSTETVEAEIYTLVNDRKLDNKKKPYCLFSTYYANIYFGIQQCIQIDSLRFAIDQVDDKNVQDWMLGILVITASVVATNYGGHFAQPQKVDRSNVVSVLEKRKKSAWLEFSKRLLAVATESEKKVNDIVIIPGPCDNALQWLEKQKKQEMLVYLDAPYKREDYSRYYHVLETLVLYDYPSSEYKGRNRSIRKGERFRSEFSTRNVDKVESQLIQIITRVIATNYICAWSYSNNGSANIMKVINCVKSNLSCEVFICATEHKHNGQGQSNGKTRGKKVIEYCIIFKKLNR